MVRSKFRHLMAMISEMLTKIYWRRFVTDPLHYSEWKNARGSVPNFRAFYLYYQPTNQKRFEHSGCQYTTAIYMWNRLTWTGVLLYTSKRTNEWYLTTPWFWINDIHIGWCVIDFWHRNRRNKVSAPELSASFSSGIENPGLRTGRHRRKVPLRARLGCPTLK